MAQFFYCPLTYFVSTSEDRDRHRKWGRKGERERRKREIIRGRGNSEGGKRRGRDKKEEELYCDVDR